MTEAERVSMEEEILSMTGAGPYPLQFFLSESRRAE